MAVTVLDGIDWYTACASHVCFTSMLTLHQKKTYPPSPSDAVGREAVNNEGTRDIPRRAERIGSFGSFGVEGREWCAVLLSLLLSLGCAGE